MAGDTIHRGVIEVAVDGSGVSAGVEQAKASLKQLEGAATSAGEKLGAGVAGGAERAGKSTEQLDAVTRRFMTTLERESLQAGKTRAEYLELRAAKLGVADSAGPLISKIRAAEKGVVNLGLSAKQTTAALRQVPAQMTDIIVSLQGGQSPMQVLLQQGGQLKDVFGGVGPAARALGNYVKGLINPFTVAAAAAATLGYAYKLASDEGDAFANALIFTNNASGTTVAEMHRMAEAAGAIVGTQGQAAEVLTLFAASGRVAAKDMERFTVTALQLKEVTGVAVADTVKQFVELGRAPAEASKKLDQQYRYLTQSVLDQIKALEEQGRATEAASLAQNAFSRNLDEGIAKAYARMGPFQQAWIDLKNTIGEAGDAVVGFFRGAGSGPDISAKIAERQRQIQSAIANPGLREHVPKWEAEIARLRIVEATTGRVAKADADRVANAEAVRKASEKIDDANKKSLTTQEKQTAELKEYRKQVELLRAQPLPTEPLARAAALKRIDPAQVQKTEAAILAGPKRSGGGVRSITEQDTGKAELDAQLATTKRHLDSLTGAYKDSESILEAVRSAGLVSEAEYYDAKRAFLRLNAEAQDDALGKQVSALEAEISRLENKKSRLKGNDRVRVEREIIDTEKKIADAQEKRLQATAAVATQTVLLNIRQKASQDALTKSFLESQMAAENYLRTFQLKQDRSVADVGRGDKARSFSSGINSIEDRAAESRQQLEREHRTGMYKDNEAAYQDQLSLLERTKQAELAIYIRGYNQLEGANSNFVNGATRALENYADSVKNIAQQTEALFSKSFQGMEDALVKFTETGRLDFKSLADSIVSDINRIIIKQNITGPLAEIIQGGFKSGEGVGGLLKSFLGPLLGDKGNGGGIVDAVGKGAGDAGLIAANTARVASITAATAADTARVASIAAVTTAETGYSAMLATASVANSTAFTLLASSANAASIALSAVSASGGASSGGGILGSLSSLFNADGVSGVPGGDFSLGGGGLGSDIGGSGFGFDFAGVGGFAAGGSPPVNRVSLVGENGPELFIPRSAGTVVPNGQTEKILRGGSRTMNLTQNFTINGPIDRRTQEQVASTAARKLQVAQLRGTL